MKTASLKWGKQKPKYAGIAKETDKGSAKAQEKQKRLERVEEFVLAGCQR